MIIIAALILIIGAFGLVLMAATSRGRLISFVVIAVLALLSTGGAFWLGRKSEQEIIRTQFYSGPKRELSQVFYILDDMAQKEKYDQLTECMRILREDWDRSAFFVFESNYGSNNYGIIIQKIEKTYEPNK